MSRHDLLPSFLTGEPAPRHASIVSRLSAAAQEWRVRRHTASLLGQLNDRMLEDIGVTRAGIESYRAGRGSL